MLLKTTVTGLIALVLLGISPASPATFETLYSFCSEADCADGSSPQSGLIADSTGTLYGTVSAGGTDGGGGVFALAPSKGTGKKKWKYTLLYSFCAATNAPTAGSHAAA